MNEIMVTRNGQEVLITIKISDTQWVTYTIVLANSRKLERDLHDINE